MAPLHVGLTGGIASGKTTVAKRFAELGVPVIDADEIARAVVAPGEPALGEIVTRFGEAVLKPSGELDRRALRDLIFADANARRDLEAILHPRIRAEMRARSAAAPGPYLVMVIPLLAEGGARDGIDRILVVDVDEDRQLERLMARDGGTREQARAILAAQASRAARLEIADDVIPNAGSLDELRTSVDRLHRRYLDLAAAGAAPSLRRSAQFMSDSRFTLSLGLDQNTKMNSHPDAQAESTLEPAPVVFEQPLNERMRTFLRLDFLYTQMIYHSETPNAWSARAGVASLLEILAITARGDARSDVLKELERHINILKDFQSKHGVDPGRLKSLMSNLLRLRNDLSAAGGNFMAPLRDSEFLSAIKHRSAIPGGTCDFDLPDYSHWLNRPPEERAEEFDAWLAMIRPLCDGIAELLWLTRENARCKPETAVGGVFQLPFDRETPCQLVRITLPAETNMFPEISGNQHRCTVRFLSWTDAASRPVHVETDVPFLLTICA